MRRLVIIGASGMVAVAHFATRCKIRLWGACYPSVERT
jgi:hypothetical protein